MEDTEHLWAEGVRGWQKGSPQKENKGWSSCCNRHLCRSQLCQALEILAQHTTGGGGSWRPGSGADCWALRLTPSLLGLTVRLCHGANGAQGLSRAAATEWHSQFYRLKMNLQKGTFWKPIYTHIQLNIIINVKLSTKIHKKLKKNEKYKQQYER